MDGNAGLFSLARVRPGEFWTALGCPVVWNLKPRLSAEALPLRSRWRLPP
jgi:hypothetical protein